jgi:hypothetical protein
VPVNDEKKKKKLGTRRRFRKNAPKRKSGLIKKGNFTKRRRFGNRRRGGRRNFN